MSDIVVGQAAPDFSLTDNHGTPVTLSELRGKNVLVVFFPFAFSGICTGELCELRDNLGIFEDSEVTLLAISCDPTFTQKAWAEQENYQFSLLSDFWPHGEVAQKYGVFDAELGLAVRGSFLIDTQGNIAWAVVNDKGQARDFAGYRKALEQIKNA